MNEEEELLNKAKCLFYKSKFEECILLLRNICKEDFKRFENYQRVMMYGSLSYFYLDQFEDVEINIKKLVDESKTEKGETIDEIDLIIRIFFLQCYFDENTYKAEDLNEEFGQLIEKYKRNKDLYLLDYNPVYLFSTGIHSFIQNWRDNTDLSCIQLLKTALLYESEYKQDIEFIMGWMYAWKDLYSQAQIHFLKIEKDNSEYPGILNSIGVTYSRQNLKASAEEYYLKSHIKFPINTLYINNLAQFYNHNQDLETSEKYFMKSLEINPKKLLTLYFYGSYLSRQGKVEQGIQYLLKGLEIDPSNVDICNSLAKIYSQQLFDQDQAEKYFKKCIELEPKCGSAYEDLGMHYIDTEEYEKAIENLKRALTLKLLKNNFHSTSSNLAFCYYELQMWEESLKTYVQSLSFPVIFETESDIENICVLLEQRQEISHQRKIEILDSQQCYFLMRLDLISNNLTDYRIKNFLKLKLVLFRQFISIFTYQQYIQPNLTYMNEISHWDLFID